MPYRVDIRDPLAGALDLLLEWGALDIESTGDELACIVPDVVAVQQLRSLSAAADIRVSAASAQDNGSVWLLRPTAIRIGSLLIGSEQNSGLDTLRLVRSPAFGTGHHPTTQLCLEALQALLNRHSVHAMLDVGTGSGILALAALQGGVPRAIGLDIDENAILTAKANAQLNGFEDRLQLLVGTPRSLQGCWPLITANLLSGPLIDMAGDLARLLAPKGMLILSGLQATLGPEVRRAYEQVGVYLPEMNDRSSWATLVGQASW